MNEFVASCTQCQGALHEAEQGKLLVGRTMTLFVTSGDEELSLASKLREIIANPILLPTDGGRHRITIVSCAVHAGGLGPLAGHLQSEGQQTAFPSLFVQRLFNPAGCQCGLNCPHLVDGDAVRHRLLLADTEGVALGVVNNLMQKFALRTGPHTIMTFGGGRTTEWYVVPTCDEHYGNSNALECRVRELQGSTPSLQYQRA